MKEKKHLSDMIDKKSHNLNLIKFIAALFVILSHSYLLSQGANSMDPISYLSNKELNLGSIGVAVFFLSSGLLITKSIVVNSTEKYFVNRIKRIFPPLIVVVVICTFVIGPVFSELKISTYFRDVETYKYLLNAIFIPIHNLPGVFADNIYSPVVNGALWTLGIEFVCYIGIFIFAKLGFLKKKAFHFIIPFCIIAFIGIYFVDIPIIIAIRPYMHPFFMFFIGMCFYIFRDHIVLSKKMLIFFILFGALLLLFRMPLIALFLAFPYLLIIIAYSNYQVNSKFSHIGVLAYSIYLVGFPVQQILVSLNGGQMNIFFNFMEAAAISLLIAIPLYVFTELPFQKKKV